jgi:hypothetical protein
MRFSRPFLLALLLALLGTSILSQAEPTAQQAPFVYGARIRGKKLIISGYGFGDGAVVLINGEPQKTDNDVELPSLILRVRKGGKRISADEISIVKVQNAEGLLSEGVPVYGGANITWTISNEAPDIHVVVGERVLLYLTNFGNKNFRWGLVPLYPPILRSVDDVILPDVPEGAYLALFEAVRSGAVSVSAGGHVPCSGPGPCPGAAPLFLTTTVFIE